MNHHQSKYAINPEKHRTFRGVPLLGYWDVYMLFLLIVVSFITPYEVAFMHTNQPIWPHWSAWHLEKTHLRGSSLSKHIENISKHEEAP